GDEVPGVKVGCVRNFAAVVVAKAAFEVIGDADVAVRRGGRGFEEVDVAHGSNLAQRMAEGNYPDGGERPASLLRSYAGHHFSRGARKMVEAVGVEPTSEGAADQENYGRIPFRYISRDSVRADKSRTAPAPSR